MDIGRLTIGADHAWDWKNNHALVRGDTCGQVSQRIGQDVDGDQSSVLAIATIEAISHGAIHVSVGNDDAAGRNHGGGVRVG